MTKKLTEVLQKDGVNLGRFLKGATRGAIRGTYTPFLLNTSGKKFIKYLDNLPGQGFIGAEYFGKSVGQGLAVAATQLYLIQESVSRGLGKTYLGTLVATNLADYLYNAYKRAKNSDEKEDK
jgi:hypothetical protein